RLDFDDIMVKLGAWYYDDEYTPTGKMFDVGNTCSYAIDNYFAHHKPIEECGLEDERSNGNGSLMRIHPFVLYAYAKQMAIDEWLGMIVKASAVTHAHDRSKIGCLIYTFVLMSVLNDQGKVGIENGLKKAKHYLNACTEFTPYERIFKSNFATLAREEIKSSGYVVDTLEAALWCVLTSANYRDCVLKAVNLGDDTDTVAAVAGGLAGALYGYDAIPAEWLDKLKRRDYMEEMCDRASSAWRNNRYEPPHKIVDIHMHVVPGYDDGPESMEESLAMLKLAESQGVTDVFCTSHNGYRKEDGEQYRALFARLEKAVSEEKINIRLHKGCEIRCSAEYMDDIVYGLANGIFSTLGNSKYVLTELYPDATPNEAFSIIRKLTEHGYKPIIAHMERNDNISSLVVNQLIQSGALIQVNAYSLADDADTEIRERARELLRNKYVHFIGSDAHRIDYRPPKMDAGVRYILENADEEYASQILSANLSLLLEG
ncbi:MAG: ADP-ribosylglycohydrolase family protein, partial [Clostridia bacterium]|nr:ADP-ribosylglycohydrolase family protein [Clostridia bacterium]